MKKVYSLLCELKTASKQRGAEMVEYAIVLACIAAVAIFFYTYNTKGGTIRKLSTVVAHLWERIANTNF